MFSFFSAFFIFSFAFAAQAKVLVTYKYLKVKKPVEKSITLTELKRAYEIVKESTFTPPSSETFFNDYLRYKLAVDVALNDKRLVKKASIDKLIANPFLKSAFHQELYKAFAELRLKNQMERLDKNSANLSNSRMKKLYNQSPEFNIFFIAIYHPINPSPKQINEVRQRAEKIHAKVLKSKKPFLELVSLYSDDKSNGSLGINRSAASIPPTVYSQLKKMKNKSISRPIRVPTGYVIVKLNQRVPFSEANQTMIKANYFTRERTKIFNAYFDGLKKDFRVNILNRELIKTL